MEETEKPRKSCSDALMKAFEQAEEMQDVLVIWFTKGDHPKLGFEDNDLSIAEANFILSSHQWHLIRKCFED